MSELHTTKTENPTPMIPKSFSRSAILPLLLHIHTTTPQYSNPPHPHNNSVGFWILKSWGEETKQPNEGDEGPVARPQHLRW